MSQWTLLCLVLLAAAPAGCKARGPRSPEQLREQYAEALRKNDPARAYALLSPEVQGGVSKQEFARRWKAEARDRKLMLEEIERLDADHAAPVRGGTTVHAGGRVLRWTRVGDRYQIIDGLPGLPDTTTPAQTIRALLAAVRSTGLSALEAILSPELAARVGEDWAARVTAIETALEQPGSIELSGDLRRAELRYDAQHAITLEQTERGWRITAIE